MKTIQEVVVEVQTLKTLVDSQQAKLVTLEAAITDTLNKKDAKIAELQAQVTAGSDAQPIADALAPVSQVITDAQPALDSTIAQVQLAGQ